MLFLVHMAVHRPAGMGDEEWADLLAAEKAYSQEHQRSGIWRHLWRVAGKHESFSVFDVADGDELHRIVSGLPLFPHLSIAVHALATHPSDLALGSEGAHG